MKEYYKRCKNCGTEYLYRINGGRWGLDDYTDQDYCPECKKRIDEVLSKVPKKYESRYHSIQDHELLDKLIHNFSIIEPDGRTIVCIYEGCKYEVKYDKGSNKWHLAALSEYDLVNDKFTGKLWYVDGRNNAYQVFQSQLISPQEIPEVPMDPPTGVLSFMDISPFNTKE